MGYSSSAVRLKAVLTVIAAFTFPQVQAQDTSAVFVSSLGQGDKAHNITFAINWSAKPDQLSFYLSGPASNSWTGTLCFAQKAYSYLTACLGVGIGEGMKGSLMFIMYSDGNGKSMRIGRPSALNPG